MILPEKNMMFIHIPKCGGTSIAAGLLDSVNISLTTCGNLDRVHKRKYMCTKESKHGTALHYKSVMGNSYNKYYKFSMIRNPWERAMSCFAWHKHMSFSFFMTWLKQQKHRQVKPMKNFIVENNILLVDEVFCFSQIQQVFGNFGLRGFHRKNENSRQWFTRLNPNQMNRFDKIITKYYKDDIEYFGFDKFGPATKNVTLL